MTTTEVRVVRNSFGLTYLREPLIRRKANHFEDALQGHYGQPQVFPVPDELDARVPRILFSSTHGYSQINISQVTASLNVNYSPDWQTSIDKCREYLRERIELIFSAITTLDNVTPVYAGLSTVIHLALDADDEHLVGLLADRLLIEKRKQQLYDILVKKVYVIDDAFFHNVVIENFRSWKVASIDERLPRNEADGFGISITGDFNDRYAYNERSSYYTDRDTALAIIEKGLAEVLQVAAFVKEEVLA